MCLILFSYNNHHRYSLILASNRDEFYDRPTEKAHWWGKNKSVLAGLDNKSGGTWLGVAENGKFSGVTNFRDPAALKNHGRSRGLLVSDYLEGDSHPHDYLTSVSGNGKNYSGFNILAGDRNELFYYSNMSHSVESVKPGYHGLSNSFLNTPWPKVTQGVNAFAECVDGKDTVPVDDLFNLLNDTTMPGDAQLPETGVGLTWERILAPIFINSDVYGTRSSAVVMIDKSGSGRFVERTYTKSGSGSFEMETIECLF